MSLETFVALCCAMTGLALVVVSLTAPIVRHDTRVVRVPIYVRVESSPWACCLGTGAGRPVEAK